MCINQNVDLLFLKLFQRNTMDVIVIPLAGIPKWGLMYNNQRPQQSFFGSDIWVKSESNLIYLSKIWVKTQPKKRVFATYPVSRQKCVFVLGLVWSRLRAMNQSKSFNMIESACLSWSFYIRNSLWLLDSPFFIQIDTFVKWLRQCL